MSFDPVSYAMGKAAGGGGGGGGTPQPKENICINWDFSDPVNSSGNSQYSSGGATKQIYSLDGWQMQGGIMDVVTGGINLSRYSNETAGYLLHKYYADTTAKMVGKQVTLSAMVDGTVGSGTFSAPAANAGSSAVTVSGVGFRLYNYGTQIALTVDIGEDMGNHLIQAIKLEFGNSQTLAAESAGTWRLLENVDKDAAVLLLAGKIVYTG